MYILHLYSAMRLTPFSLHVFVKDVRDTKIVQLAKKCRQLNVSLQHEKSKNVKLAVEMQSLEDKLLLKERRPNSADSESGGRGLGSEEPREAVSVLKVELSQSKAAVQMLQKQADALRAKLAAAQGESKKLKTVLIKEVGAGVELSEYAYVAIVSSSYCRF